MVPGVVVGKRTAAKARPLVQERYERTDGRLLNLITADEYPACATASAAVCAGPEESPTGTTAAPRRPDGLVCATVPKTREPNRAGQGEARLVFGTLLGLAAARVWAVLSCVSTVFGERSHGTDRHRNSRKVRKTYRSSKDWGVPAAMTCFTRSGGNFCWGIRRRREEAAPQRYRQRTAALVAGLTDQGWSLEEGLLFPSTAR